MHVIEGINFSIWGANDIRRESVVHITEKKRPLKMEFLWKTVYEILVWEVKKYVQLVVKIDVNVMVTSVIYRVCTTSIPYIMDNQCYTLVAVHMRKVWS